MAGSLEVKKQNNKLGELKEIHSSCTKKTHDKKGRAKWACTGEDHESQEKTYLREFDFIPRAIGNH